MMMSSLYFMMHSLSLPLPCPHIFAFSTFTIPFFTTLPPFLQRLCQLSHTSHSFPLPPFSRLHRLRHHFLFFYPSPSFFFLSTSFFSLVFFSFCLLYSPCHLSLSFFSLFYAMNDNHLTLFCLVDGEATSNAFSVKIPLSDTIDDLKGLIKTKKTNDFQDVDADKLTLWRVSIHDDDDNDLPVLLDSVPVKKKLRATNKLSM